MFAEYWNIFYEEEQLHIWSFSDKQNGDVSGEALNDFQTMNPASFDCKQVLKGHVTMCHETVESIEVSH